MLNCGHVRCASHKKILRTSFYMIYLKNHANRKYNVGFQGVGAVGVWDYCLIGTELHTYNEKSCEKGVSDGCTGL